MKYIAIIALALAVFPTAAQSSANMLAKAQTCIADVKARFAPDSRQAISISRPTTTTTAASR